MRFTMLLCMVIYSISFNTHATSRGARLEGVIISVSGAPAVCLPAGRQDTFPLGWFSIAGRDAAVWAFELKAGATPLFMKGGDCIVLAQVPSDYQVTSYGRKPLLGRVEAGKTYSALLSDALRPTDSYSAVFCVEESDGRRFHYRQYTRLAGGHKLTPPCADSAIRR